MPSWLDGSYVKNGPARRGFGDGRTYSSYMDSWGKLHKYEFFLFSHFIQALQMYVFLRFTFNEGDVSFSGRMLETTNYNKSVAAGKMVPTITIAHVEPNDWSMEEMVGFHICICMKNTQTGFNSQIPKTEFSRENPKKLKY